MKIRLKTLNAILIVLIAGVSVTLVNVATAVEVEPTYNDPTTFEEKKKQEVDDEPACD